MDIEKRSADGTLNQQPINPLQRVFIPIEKRNVLGQLTFQTLDRTKYVRHVSGAFVRAVPKMRGKAARRAEKQARRDVHSRE